MPLTYNEKKYYSPSEFAKDRGVTVQTIYNWIKNKMTKDGANIDVITIMDKTFLRIK
jgi:intergrase/recombinase